MKTATLINEIITSLERLIISIRTLYTNIKDSFKKRKMQPHNIDGKKYFRLEPYIFKFNTRSDD